MPRSAHLPRRHRAASRNRMAQQRSRGAVRGRSASWIRPADRCVRSAGATRRRTGRGVSRVSRAARRATARCSTPFSPRMTTTRRRCMSSDTARWMASSANGPSCSNADFPGPPPTRRRRSDPTACFTSRSPGAPSAPSPIRSSWSSMSTACDPTWTPDSIRGFSRARRSRRSGEWTDGSGCSRTRATGTTASGRRMRQHQTGS
jgi:hypothetical protein